jgi:threonine synthase
MCGFQAAGSAPIYYDKVIENPETLATAIRIGNPASWQSAKDAISESSGHLDIVTDEEIVEAYKMLAKYEGVFVEPASAASVAGLIKMNAQNYFEKGSTVVCINTGHGLKDPDNAIKFSVEPITLPNDTEAVLKHLNLDS